MGLSGIGKRDDFRARDSLVTIGACAAALAAAMAAVAIAVALVAFGLKEVAWVLSVPGREGVISALVMTAVIVAIAAPLTFAVALFAASSAGDPIIGGIAGRALRESFAWSSGIPPVVVGTAVLLCAIALDRHSALAAAIAALTLLNLPNATARLAHAFDSVPRRAREAAAALGASPAAVFFGLVQPSAVWAVASVLFVLLAQMVGETSAVALAISASGGPEPLAVQIWHFASNISLAGTESASCIVLVLVVGLCLGLSKACARRHLETMATSG
jgi:ABC-type phosphate transport system permease subunit